MKTTRVQSEITRLSAERPLASLLASLMVFVIESGCARYHSKPVDPGNKAVTLDSRSLTNHGLRDFLATNCPSAMTSWPPASWDFDSLTWAAFYYHPSLDIARAQWSVTQAGIKTAGGRPNPVLTLTPGYDFSAANGISPWFPSVTLDVPIETAGKRKHRIDQAEHKSEAARWNIAATAWQVRSAVRAALLDWTMLTRRLELLTEQEGIQNELTTRLEQRLAEGAADSAEVTQYRLAWQRLQLEVATTRRQAATAHARLAEAIGVTVRALEQVPIAEHLDALLHERDILDTAGARQLALRGRADILSSLADYAAAESALQLEIARQYPDVHLSPGYQWDQGDHKWSLGLSMELPVLNRNQGPIAEAEARREESSARFLGLQARILAEIDLAITHRELAGQELLRARQLVEAQQSAEQQAEARYREGAIDLVEAQGARLELATGRLVLLETQFRSAQAAGQLEDALQQPATGWPGAQPPRRTETVNATP